MKKKGILIDKTKRNSKVVTFEDELHELYRLLDCDCIDITSRKIGDKYYDIVCDDEGLLRDNIRVTAYDVKGNPALVGNLLIMNHDEMGELLSLTEEDILNVEKYVHTCMFPILGEVHCILTEIDY